VIGRAVGAGWREVFGRKSTARLVVVVSDLHCGHRLGLLAPDTELLEESSTPEDPETWIPSLGPTQRYLWDLYSEHLQAVTGRGAEVTVIVNGDLTHGVRYGEGLFTGSIYDQCVVAEKCLEPWLELGASALRIVRGTASHTVEGSTESLIAGKLKASYPEANVGIAGHGLFAIGQVFFDVAHHGPSRGIREWTSGNQARYYLRSLMFGEIGRGRRPPDWVIRSHYHTYLPPERVNAGGYTSEIVLTPSYCGMNGHGRQATRSQHVQTHGLIVFEVEGARCHCEPMIETMDLRSAETL